tara:strand:+ start:737 stop:1063 length:327 start_codon:yes stop_codon:yes gene_type:complete
MYECLDIIHKEKLIPEIIRAKNRKVVDWAITAKKDDKANKNTPIIMVLFIPYLDNIIPEGISNISIPIALAETIKPIINVVAAISSDAKPGNIGIIIPCAIDNKKDGI